MNKQKLINKTIKILKKLPEDKIHQVSDFADYILKKNEEDILQKGLENIVSESKSFEFLLNEEELYDESDLKEKYGCKR